MTVVAEPSKLERFHSSDIGRVSAFSDCVFSIAITLLVLNFRTPNLSGGDIDQKLFEFVKGDYELLISYFLSAFVISRYWLAHHRMFRLVRRSDPVMLELNLLHLVLVALIPWPTELVGRYTDTTTAVVLYAGSVAAAGLTSTALWRHTSRAGLLDEDVTPEYLQHALFRGMSMPIVFAVSIPIAFVDPSAAELSWFLIVLVRFVGHKRWGSIHRPFAT